MAKKSAKSQSPRSQEIVKDRLRPLYSDGDVRRLAPIPHPTDLGAESYRTEFRRDYARLIHSPSFRRLQGKVQLFPSHESDFFRNRLTHSLEVAQIAKSIAIRLNSINPYFQRHPIDTDLVEFAGLAHDLGHPPFGHNGEDELDHQMIGFGGFEGNAQTLRIICRLEKKQTLDFPSSEVIPVRVREKADRRAGLNLTFRTIASILKYDREIGRTRSKREGSQTADRPAKGYYATERQIVQAVKENIVGGGHEGEFKTIECSIMDIADDIAYSTYDLEDSFKAGFLSPLSIVAMPEVFKKSLVDKIGRKIDSEYSFMPGPDREFNVQKLDENLRRIFSGVIEIGDGYLAEGEYDLSELSAAIISITTGTSEQLCRNGYFRSEFTSELVGRFVRSVNVEVDEKFPSMSKARLSFESFVAVEILKLMSFDAIIMSPRLKSAEHRGKWIVQRIFEVLKDDKGYMLMPEDWRSLIDDIDDDDVWKQRTICDYIAGMTDRYCIEYYERILGRSGPSIQKQY